MEASSSASCERFWTEDKERTLIALYSNHSCLWNHKSDSYKNRQLRWKTLEHLRTLLSAHPPPVPFTVEDIKNKFKNLRTTFQRQYKMVNASKAPGSEDVFLSQWKHYQQLMFLRNCWEQEDGSDDPRLPHLPVSLEEPLKLGRQPVLASPSLIISFLPAPSASSCSSSSAVGKCFWTEEKECALISFYSEHSCLWNKKSEDHNNRHLRMRTLETLRSQLSEQQPVPFTVDDIKGKFKNLRTVFNREYKAVKGSKVLDTDKLYVSQWKHYQRLQFLRDSYEDEDNADDPQLLVSQEEPGSQVPSSSLNSFSSSAAHVDTKPVIAGPYNFGYSSSATCQSGTKANAATQCRDHLSAAADRLIVVNQDAPSTLPVFTSSSLQPDTKPSLGAPSQCPTLLQFSAGNAVQPDARLSADNRCHWTDAKVRQLISFYSAHSCLWNHRSESYRNRQLRQSTMDTLSNLLSENHPVPFTAEDIKTKFRNLRTIFQREHKSVSSNKTCGSEDFYLPKWKHYRQLMFLCDSCDEDDGPDDVRFLDAREDGVPEPGGRDAPSVHHAASAAADVDQTETKHSVVAQSREALLSPTPPASLHSSPSTGSPSSSPSTSSCHTHNSKGPGRKRPSRATQPAASEALDFMRTFCQNSMVSPHAGFLKYVEECLNETPPDKVKRLKKKIIETIHSVSEEI